MQKILIVDDSEINREILAAMLEKTYEIDMAKDGQEAIEILEKKWETYQIVLLDLNMPVINRGYSLFYRYHRKISGRKDAADFVSKKL